MKKVFTQHRERKADLAGYNRRESNYVLRKEAREKKAQRQQELTNGLPMTERELREMEYREIKALEEKLGFDGVIRENQTPYEKMWNEYMH